MEQQNPPGVVDASGLKIIFEWELPDGSIRSGNQLDWTPTIESLSNQKPLIYRAWVEGFKDTTTTERTLSYTTWAICLADILDEHETIDGSSTVRLVVNRDHNPTRHESPF